MRVALFTRAWIEMGNSFGAVSTQLVALFTRAWIEILQDTNPAALKCVALFTRAWIEIPYWGIYITAYWSPSSRGRGLKSMTEYEEEDVKLVALFTRAWIEIHD